MAESLTWYRCQNRIEKYYHHDGEQLTFLSKSATYQSTQAEKRRMFLHLYCKKYQFTWQKLYSRENQMPHSTWLKLT